MNKYLINKYITIPMAISVIKQDKEHFNPSKFNYVYQDLLDTAIKRMEQDFRKLQPKFYNAVTHLDGTRYNVNGEIIEYTPDELKELTTETMKEYFKGSVEWKEHIWED